jgi:hypothetical protein
LSGAKVSPSAQSKNMIRFSESEDGLKSFISPVSRPGQGPETESPCLELIQRFQIIQTRHDIY